MKNKPSLHSFSRKSLGQHFLIDADVIQQIINAISPRLDDVVVEIGAGLGALTTDLVAHVKSLVVIELDRRCADRLRRKFPYIEVYQQDILSFDFSSLRNRAPFRVVGNLPYNISTPILFHMLSFSNYIRDMVFMLQKEVAERLCARPSTPEYGRLSVMYQTYFQPEYLFDIPATAFEPVPQVTSALVYSVPSMTFSNRLRDKMSYAALVRSAFSHKRKTLRNALKSHVKGEQFEQLGIDDKMRPSSLSVSDYVELANSLDLKIYQIDKRV